MSSNDADNNIIEIKSPIVANKESRTNNMNNIHVILDNTDNMIFIPPGDLLNILMINAIDNLISIIEPLNIRDNSCDIITDTLTNSSTAEHTIFKPSTSTKHEITNSARSTNSTTDRYNNNSTDKISETSSTSTNSTTDRYKNSSATQSTTNKYNNNSTNETSTDKISETSTANSSTANKYNNNSSTTDKTSSTTTDYHVKPKQYKHFNRHHEQLSSNSSTSNTKADDEQIKQLAIKYYGYLIVLIVLIGISSVVFYKTIQSRTRYIMRLETSQKI